MKKNKFMRLASALLVLTLLSTCAISGTFAKYTTTSTATDAARVAYWGFDQGATQTFALFNHGDAKIVSAVTGEKVIAPGSTGSAAFAFGYTANTGKSITAPEVDYKFTVDVDISGSNTTKLDANESFKWTLKKGNETATTYDTLDDLASAIKALSGDASGSKDYTAGSLPTAFTAADEVYTVGWAWAIDGQDAKDTELGNMQTLENISIKITITATQLD